VCKDCTGTAPVCLQLLSPNSLVCLQRFVDRDLFLSWVRRRAASIKHVQLDFDAWCRQYYQGAFSAVQASRSVATLLELVRGSLQQLKVQDTSFVVNSKMLRSLATATHLRHLQLFGVSSQILVSDALKCVTYLKQLKNLELADSEDHRQAVAFSPNGGLKKPVLHLLAAVSSLQMSEQNCILPPLALR